MAERADIDRAELAQVFDNVRGLLGEVRQGDADAPPEEVQGDGTADEERVRVSLSADGRVREVRLHRKSMQSSEDLAEFVRQAANRAREDLERKLAREPTSATAQHRAFAARALEMQKDSAQRLGRMIDDLADTMNKVSRAAGTNDRAGKEK